MLSDAHLHLHEIVDGSIYPDLDELSLAFSCTATPEEWNTPIRSGSTEIRRFYGVHPWYAGRWNDEVGSRLVSILESDPDASIGEIGMDSLHPDPVLQYDVMCEQLSIASEFSRPVTIHMNGCEKEVLDGIRSCSGDVPVILHSFKSESYVKPFSSLNCYFSVGPRLLYKSRGNISRIISSIPEDRLLIETDAPHSGRMFEGIKDLVSRFAEVMDKSTDEMAGTVTANLRRIHGR